MKYPKDMDKECVSLCNAINLFFPDIFTIESCCGHGKDNFAIWFKVDNLEVLPRILYYFDPCHSGFVQEGDTRAYSGFAWQVKVRTDCAMQYPTFLLEGPIGTEAYEQADLLAKEITKEFAE